MLYAYDTHNHIIAELNTSGQTLREYIWLDDMPAAVVDNVDTTPVIYYVQTDHLMRPARMTDQDGNWVWDVIYSPFGATAYINENPAVMDIRFPGQWFQLETGLAYNWHRHYDATTGRYVQPDPLLDDDGQISVRGISTNVFGATSSEANGHLIANAMGWLTSDALMQKDYSPRAMLPDGPSLYGYAGQSPLAYIDPNGTQAIWPLLQGMTRACAANASCSAAAAAGAVAASQAIGSVLGRFCKPENHCPPCDPPAGTQCYETQTGHSHNGWDPHHHIWSRNQNPNTCACFWNRGSGTTGTTPTPPQGLNECNTYSTWP